MSELTESKWIEIYQKYVDQKLVPILGDGFFSECMPGTNELIDAWKDHVNYPFTRHPSISRLARFVTVESDTPGVIYLTFVKQHLLDNAEQAPSMSKTELFKAHVADIASNVFNPLRQHNVLRSLARLQLPIFITTSYYEFLERELEKAGKKPESAICYWRKDLKPGINISNGEIGRLRTLLMDKFSIDEAKNLAQDLFGDAYESLPNEGKGSLFRELIGLAQREDKLEDLIKLARQRRPAHVWDSLMEAMGMSDEQSVSRVPSIFLEEPEYQPSPDRPLVFHLYGIETHPKSLVLTEDDYIDFLIFTSRQDDALPPPVLRALSDSSIIMLGYELYDWEFIILFRGLIASRRRRRSKVNICLQHLPSEEDSSIAADRRQEAETYLRKYLYKADFSIYSGGSESFLSRLQAE